MNKNKIYSNFDRIFWNSGQTPTVAPSNYKSDGTWSYTDLEKGEIAINTVDERIWYRSENNIIEFITTSNSGSSSSSYWSKVGSTLYPSTITDDVQIGNSSNTSSFHLYGDFKMDYNTTGYYNHFLMLNASDPSNGCDRFTIQNPASKFMLQAYGSGSPGYLNQCASIWADAPSQGMMFGTTYNAPIYFAPYNSYSNPKMVIKGDGKVGIGTMTPTATLEVKDLIKFDNYNSFVGVNAGDSTTGSNNSFFGYKTGYNNTTGAYNNIIGAVSGYKLSSGSRNNIFGYGAGYNTTTGSYNTFMGHSTAYSNTTGGYNTFIGYQSGYYNTTGNYGVAIGHQAGLRGQINTQVAIGSFALSNLNGGTGNVAVGYGSLKSNTTGNNNIGIGHTSLYTISTGGDNIGIGRNAGYYNSTGSRNINIGTSAGLTNSSGNDNINIGLYSGYKNTANYNNFIGTYAGYSNTTGTYNNFIGYNAGKLNTTGSYNNFIGTYAGKNNTTGYDNFFFGYRAGYGNTTGYKNIYIGDYIGENSTTANQNLLFGYQAARQITTGNMNTIMGYNAGYYLTEGTENIFMGYRAGQSITTGHYNTAVGTKAGFSNQTGNQNVFLGYNAGYYETGSNKLYIANSDTSNPLIYGDFNYKKLILGGSGNTFSTGITNSSIINCYDETLATSDTVMMPRIELTMDGEGVIMVSPSGYRYKLTVDDYGNLSTVSI